MYLPKIPLVLMFLLTSVLLVGVSVLFWIPDQDLEPNLLVDFRIQEIAGGILYLDEVLTMSARMSAATGDPKWEERYRLYEPELDADIQEAMRLARSAFMNDGAGKTLGANEILVKLEHEAFDRVRQRDLEGATALLSSDRYEEQKKAYSAGLESITSSLRDQVNENLKNHRRVERVALAVFLGGLIFAGLFWVSLLMGQSPIGSTGP